MLPLTVAQYDIISLRGLGNGNGTDDCKGRDFLVLLQQRDIHHIIVLNLVEKR